METTTVTRIRLQNLPKVEKLCRERKLLGKDEYLTDEINFDCGILESMDICLNDICATFRNMIIKLHQTNAYQKYTTLEINDKWINTVSKMFKYYTTESTVCNEIGINNKKLRVYCRTINEFECSPLDLAIMDENSCKVFDKIYFITDCSSGHNIWFSDMSIHHIKKYGFFGGSKSIQRLDPVLFCEMFGLKAGIKIHPIQTKILYRWRSLGKVTEDKLKYVCKHYQSSILEFYIYNKGQKMYIKFKNENWIKHNQTKVIKILKVPLTITPEYYDGKWHVCKIIQCPFIKNDDAEMNNYISLCENMVLATAGDLVKADILHMIKLKN